MAKTAKVAQASDPIASVLAGLVGIAGSLGLLSRWGITVDDAAAVVGFAGMVAAALRGWWEHKRTGPTLEELFAAAPLDAIERVLEARAKSDSSSSSKILEISQRISAQSSSASLVLDADALADAEPSEKD